MHKYLIRVHSSFEVEESKVFGPCPNGTGKATTVRMLSCLISPSEASAIAGGYKISRDSMKAKLGF